MTEKGIISLFHRPLSEVLTIGQEESRVDCISTIHVFTIEKSFRSEANHGKHVYLQTWKVRLSMMRMLMLMDGSLSIFVQ